MQSVFSSEYAILLRTLIDGRKASSLTQTDLAKLLGKPQSFVSKYERGERRLDVVELIEVCRHLGLDPHAVVDDIQACASISIEGQK